MGRQIKKKARSFSLDDEEWQTVLETCTRFGFEDRNAYLMALIEAAEILKFRPQLDQETHRKILRPTAYVQAESRELAVSETALDDLAALLVARVRAELEKDRKAARR
jgi:hypothetical protein